MYSSRKSYNWLETAGSWQVESTAFSLSAVSSRVYIINWITSIYAEKLECHLAEHYLFTWY